MPSRARWMVWGMIWGLLIGLAAETPFIGNLRAEPLDQTRSSVVDCIAYQAQPVAGALVVDETTAVEACEAAIRALAGQLAGDGLPPGAAHGRAEDFAREAYREHERNLPPCPLPSV